MATRELTDQEDIINVLKFRNASERPLFHCQEHKEEVRVIAEGTENPVTLTGCCDSAFDSFIEHVKHIGVWAKVFEHPQAP